MNQYNDLITVIVPVYNVEKYLERCIESIINQTYKNLEIILVDDGSTDNSGNICDEYAKKDERIKVIHKENGGQATARNMALDIAKGNYIAFADSDDWVDTSIYEKLYNALISNEANICVCARYNVYNDGKKETVFVGSESKVLSSEEAIKKILTYDNMDVASCDKLYDASVLKDNQFPVGYICEDIPFVFNAVINAKKVIYINEPLYFYLQRSGSTSKSDFSEKSKGLEIYHTQVAEFVKNTYPTLKKEADFYEYQGKSTLLLMLEKEENIIDIKYYKYLKNNIRKNILKIICSKYFTYKKKVLVFLSCFGVYKSIRKIRNIVIYLNKFTVVMKENE